MGVVHGGGWFIRSSHVALIYSPKPRIYFIHYAFPGAEQPARFLEAVKSTRPIYLPLYIPFVPDGAPLLPLA